MRWLHTCALVAIVQLAAAVPFAIVSDIPGRNASNVFSAQVRPLHGSGDWTESFVLQTTAQNSTDCKAVTDPAGCGYFSHLNGWSASWLTAEVAEGEGLQVRVQRLNGPNISSARPYPLSAGVQVVSVGPGGVILSVPGPAQFMVAFDDNGFDKVDTGAAYKGPPVHTFAVFVNPLLPVPNATDPSVTVVKPGSPIPTNLTAGSTLVFANGVHRVPRDENGWRVWPLPSDVRVFLSAGAILHSALNNTGSWGKDNITLVGYGVVSGEEQARCPAQHVSNDDNNCCCAENNSPQGLSIDGAHRAVIDGPTFVDHPNHHAVLDTTSCTPNSVFRNVKVWGWRANGDGLHLFGPWEISDLFMRTQDDGMYTATGDNVKNGCNPSTFQRVTLWNDANGASFVVTGNNNLLTDCDVIFQRTSWEWWQGDRAFAYRQMGPVANLTFHDIRISDPLPSFNPFSFDARPSTEGHSDNQPAYKRGKYAWALSTEDVNGVFNVSFQNITVANFSTTRTCPSWGGGCGCQPDCKPGNLPVGPPNFMVAAPDPTYNISLVSINNLTVAGQPFGHLLSSEPGLFNISGSVFNISVDGTPIH